MLKKFSIALALMLGPTEMLKGVPGSDLYLIVEPYKTKIVQKEYEIKEGRQNMSVTINNKKDEVSGLLSKVDEPIINKVFKEVQTGSKVAVRFLYNITEKDSGKLFEVEMVEKDWTLQGSGPWYLHSSFNPNDGKFDLTLNHTSN